MIFFFENLSTEKTSHYVFLPNWKKKFILKFYITKKKKKKKKKYKNLKKSPKTL